MWVVCARPAGFACPTCIVGAARNGAPLVCGFCGRLGGTEEGNRLLFTIKGAPAGEIDSAPPCAFVTLLLRPSLISFPVLRATAGGKTAHAIAAHRVCVEWSSGNEGGRKTFDPAMIAVRNPLPRTPLHPVAQISLVSCLFAVRLRSERRHLHWCLRLRVLCFNLSRAFHTAPQREQARGNRLRCGVCHKPGASAGCARASCSQSYHVQCASESRDIVFCECVTQRSEAKRRCRRTPAALR